MTSEVDYFVKATVNEIEREQFRPEPVEMQRLAKAEAVLARVSPWEYGRIANFLSDLAERPPVNGGATWRPFYEVLKALSADLSLAAYKEDRE